MQDSGMIMALARADGLTRRKLFAPSAALVRLVEIFAIAADTDRFSHPRPDSKTSACIYMAGKGRKGFDTAL
jgi:hypothetical protein